MTIPASLPFFLSLCLLYPRPELAGQLQQAAQEAHLSWAQKLAAVFGSQDLEELQVEHTRLFVAGSPPTRGPARRQKARRGAAPCWQRPLSALRVGLPGRAVAHPHHGGGGGCLRRMGS